MSLLLTWLSYIAKDMKRNPARMVRDSRKLYTKIDKTIPIAEKHGVKQEFDELVEFFKEVAAREPVLAKYERMQPPPPNSSKGIDWTDVEADSVTDLVDSLAGRSWMSSVMPVLYPF